MNEIQVVIIFFTFLFVGSLLYTAKKKKESLFSFLLNLELEYVIVGLVLYYMTDKMPLPEATLAGIMHLLLAFMGLALGTHFSVKLLLTVPKRFYTYSLSVYIIMTPVLYFLLKVMGCNKPLLMAIALNTLMPYSINLSMKLFRVPKDKIFVSNLTASLFPFIALLAYSIAAGAVDYRPIDFAKSMLASILISTLFLHYGKAKSKKSVHKLSILFVVMVSGIAIYYEISPLVLGFLTGFIKSDTKYGNIFQEISISFERILYIFFYVALGVMLGYGFTLGFGEGVSSFATAIGLYGCFVLVRMLIGKLLASKMLPTKDECVCLVSTGILPAAMLLDYGTRNGYASVAKLFIPFFILHLATEITTYFMIKNERKTN